MVETRRYHNSFIEVKTDEIITTCYNKEQAQDTIYNLLDVIKELEEFMEDADD